MGTEEKEVASFAETFRAIEDEVARLIVGNRDVLRKTLVAFFAGGHVLLEGVPGLGKTRLVRAVADALGLEFRRIQFTPDLMPSDIVGSQILAESDGGREFRFRKGPVFANVVLADEINRATPKTQSAVLEAMEERQVTSFGETFRLEDPFFVLATQNPIELEGTYPLPEAQLDRFLFKLVIGSPGADEIKEILRRTTAADTPVVGTVLDGTGVSERIAGMKRLVREVVVAPPIEDYVASLLLAASPGRPEALEAATRFVRLGPGPRAAQSMVLAAKVAALLDGRGHVSGRDVAEAALPAMRHRMIVNFEAEAEGVTPESILEEVLARVRKPS